MGRGTFTRVERSGFPVPGVLHGLADPRTGDMTGRVEVFEPWRCLYHRLCVAVLFGLSLFARRIRS